ncbi:MAG: hypothetical protein WAL95_04900 [Candidatus Acidiferrales bacterium]
MSDGLPISTIRNIVYGDDGFDFDKCDPDADSNADIKKQFHDAEVSNKIGNGGPSCIIDLPLPDADDVDVDGAYWKAPRVVRYNPDALRKSSGKKFVELLALVRKTFDGHPEEYDECVEIVTKARDQARAEALARI